MSCPESPWLFPACAGLAVFLLPLSEFPFQKLHIDDSRYLINRSHVCHIFRSHRDSPPSPLILGRTAPLRRKCTTRRRLRRSLVLAFNCGGYYRSSLFAPLPPRPSGFLCVWVCAGVCVCVCVFVSTPLAGPIPAEIGKASSLEILDCQKNMLSGWRDARASLACRYSSLPDGVEFCTICDSA